MTVLILYLIGCLIMTGVCLWVMEEDQLSRRPLMVPMLATAMVSALWFITLPVMAVAGWVRFTVRLNSEEVGND